MFHVLWSGKCSSDCAIGATPALTVVACSQIFQLCYRAENQNGYHALPDGEDEERGKRSISSQGDADAYREEVTSSSSAPPPSLSTPYLPGLMSAFGMSHCHLGAVPPTCTCTPVTRPIYSGCFSSPDPYPHLSPPLHPPIAKAGITNPAIQNLLCHPSSCQNPDISMLLVGMDTF